MKHDSVTATIRAALRQHVPNEGQRAALARTPQRWQRALVEMTAGYDVDVRELLAVQFDDVPCDEMVVLRGIDFASVCEHHLMPFVGTAAVAYLPSDRRVVGLSKLARLVDAHARRLQVQERLTSDVAGDLMQHLRPLGAGCVVRARHACMACRGANKPGAEMVTCALLGNFREPGVRAEFLSHAAP